MIYEQTPIQILLLETQAGNLSWALPDVLAARELHHHRQANLP
jgi:hypothetical protein